MKRDDFKKGIIRILSEQVSHRCSNPDCRVMTAAPGNNKGGVNRVGQAAHITAASPGGPRYDPGMTPEERRSADNGIWLCNICAKKIDNSPDEFSTGLIRQWKASALSKAKEELGKALPSEDYAVNLLSTAILGSTDRNVPKYAINNTHEAAEMSLEKKYPGFNFKTSYENGRTSISVNPEPGYNVKLEFNASNPEDAYQKYRNFIKTGKPTQFEVKNIRVDGPEILQPNDTDESSLLSVGSANSKPSTLKIISIHKNSKIYFDDIVGECYAGSHAVYFLGTACGGLVEASLVASNNDDLIEPLNIKFNYDIWNKKSVRSLPYMKKTASFLNSINSSEKVTIKIEVEGEDAFNASAKPENFSSNNIELIELISKARDISIELDQDIILDLDYFSKDDIKNIEYIHSKLNFQRNKELEDEPTLEINFVTEIRDLNGFKHMTTQPETQIRLNDCGPRVLRIFGQEIELPELTQFFISVKAEATNEIEKHKTYELTIKPQSGFQLWEGFNVKKNKKIIKKVCEQKEI